MFDEHKLKKKNDGVNYWVGGTAKENFLSKGEFKDLKFECKQLNDVIQGFGQQLKTFHFLHTVLATLPSYLSEYETAQKELQEGKKLLDIFDKALEEQGWPTADILPDQFPTVTEVEVGQQNIADQQAAHKFFTGTGQSIDEQRLTHLAREYGPLNANGPDDSAGGSIQVASLRSGDRSAQRDVAFPSGNNEREMRSLDSARTNASKRTRLEDADEAEAVEGTSDGRVKRSRKMKRQEPAPRIYQTRSRTKSDEREKREIEEMSVQRPRRVTRSMTRSASRK